MFVYRKVYPFTWTVKVPAGPAGDAFEFKAKFIGVTQSRLDEIRKSDPDNTDATMAKEVFVGWEDGELVDESGVAIPVTPDNIAGVIDLPFMRTAIVTTYLQALAGLLAKN
jgi:hypothetical protein